MEKMIEGKGFEYALTLIAKVEVRMWEGIGTTEEVKWL